jgi:small-conductance mechanosensitive channel
VIQEEKQTTRIHVLEDLKSIFGMEDKELWRNTAASVLLLLLMMLLRVVVARNLLRVESVPLEQRRRWMVSLRNAAVFIFLFGLLIIWAEQVRTWALSLVAVAAAFVIATKELILCVSGAVLRGFSRPFTVGDRVEIGGIRGDILDQSILTTTILEVGPGAQNHHRTGRSITVPNSMLLSGPVINESYLDDFVLHAFSVMLSPDEDWEESERILLEAAQQESASFIQQAIEQSKAVARKEGFDSPSMEPRTTVRIPEANKIELLVRIPCPLQKKSSLEQAILRRYLKAIKQLKIKQSQEKLLAFTSPR